MPDMAYDIPSLEAEQQAILKRQAIAQMLMQKGMTPMELPQTPARGYTPSVSPLQGLAQIANAYVGKMQNDEANKQLKDLAAQASSMQRSDYQKIVDASQPRLSESALPSINGMPQEGPGLPQLTQPTRQSVLSVAASLQTPQGMALLEKVMPPMPPNAKYAHASAFDEKGNPTSVLFNENYQGQEAPPTIKIGGSGIKEETPHTDVRKGPDGKDHDYLWNPKTQRFDIDQGLAKDTWSNTGRWIDVGTDKDGNLIQKNNVTGEIKYTPISGGVINSKTAPNMPAAEADKSATLDNITQLFDKVKTLYKPSYVGYVAGRVGNVEDTTGIGADPQRASFKKYLADIQNQILYLRSGKAINESEFNRLMNELPNPNTSQINFEAGMNKFEDEMKMMQSNRTKEFEKYGFRGQGAQVSPKSESPLIIDEPGLKIKRIK